MDPFVFKTAEFSKRNFNRARSTLAHLIYEIKKVKRGFGNLKNDCLFVLGVKKKNINYKYRREAFMEGQKVRQVKIDVIKFIPFSFFILIPGAEILLPPFLVIFPNSVPSQFMSDEARAKKFQEIKDKREAAAKILSKRLQSFMFKLENDENIMPEDIERIKALKLALQKPKLLPTDLLQYKDIFRSYADFQYFSVDGLVRIANFMSLNPVTGLNIINNILRIFKLEIPVNTPVINIFTKAILVRELRMYFSRIRKEDESLSFVSLDKYSEE